MSIKIRRYHADESEFTFTGRNKTKVTIPGNVGFTDGTQNQLILDMHVDVKEGQNTVLYPATFGLRGQVVGAQSIIRNAVVTSREHGLMNERRHQNVIDSNIDWYLTSRSKEDQRSVYGHINNKNYGHDAGSLLPDNPWLLYNLPPTDDPTDAFTTAAVKRRAEIPVAWKHIDQFASMPKFPNIAIGDLDYNIEFENQIVTMSPVEMAVMADEIANLTAVDSKVGTAAAPLITERARSQFNRPPQPGDQIALRFVETVGGARVDRSGIIATVTGSGVAYAITLVGGLEIASVTGDLTSVVMYRSMRAADGAVIGPYFVNPATALIDPVAPGTDYQVGVTGAPLILPNIYPNSSNDNKHMCPLYVGAPIHVSANVGAVVYKGYFKVASLRPNGANLEVILDAPLVVGAVDPGLSGVLNVRLAFVDHSAAHELFTVTWTIDEVYAKMHEIQMQPAQLDETLKKLRDGQEFAWLDQRLLQQTVTETSTMTQVIELQPNCYGVALLTPQTLELLSGFDGATSYRFALDGKEQSTRDIVCGTDPTTGRQGHNYLLTKYFQNLGQALSKYDANYYDYGSPDNMRTHAIYALVTPFLPRQQVLQVQLFAGNHTMASKNLFFVSTHERTLKISNGRVTVS